MQTFNFAHPENSLNNNKVYYLLLRPDELSYFVFNYLKRQADNFLDTEEYVKSYPHITLLQFRMNEKDEQKLVVLVKRFLLQFHNTRLQATGLDEFPRINTIIVKLENQEILTSIVEKVYEAICLELLVTRPKKLVKPNLHVTIAKHVSSDRYQGLKQYLFDKDFREREVLPGKLLLLKKDNPYQTQWDKVFEFEFPGQSANA